MAKAKFDYATENVVRRGDELGQYSAKPTDALHLVMVRRFDPARLELGQWVQANEMTQDEAAAQDQFTFIADHMRSEGALSVCWVQVNNWSKVENPEFKIGKYNCVGVIRDVRSSPMLQAHGGVPRNVAMDAIGLAVRVNECVSEWIDSQDQTGDDAAKDAAFPPSMPTDGPMGPVMGDGPGECQPTVDAPAGSGAGEETDHRHDSPMHEMGDSNGDGEKAKRRKHKAKG